MNEDLKNLLKNAKTKEEAKQILDGHREELSDEDLQSLAGGTELLEEIITVLLICF